MTNDTTPTENGSADAAALLAAIQNETTESTLSETTPAEPKPPSFDDMGLHPDVKQALDDMGYFAPTPVQTAVFTPVSEGKNLLVQSRTGTGKTTAFGLPLVNKMVPTHRQPQALILAPTRELALQVARELTQIGKHRGIVIEAVYGGAPIGKQINALRNGVHIVVGTPGRVLDHIGRRTLDCKTISTFVLDECDEMLSMGFLEDIEKITSYLPDKHQTLLFSATMPDEVQRYARRHMQEREQISLSRDSVSVSDIHHAYYIVSGIARSRDLLKILYAENPESAIIFCNMRDETTMVAKMLQKQGLDAEPLSSDLSQSDRERVMARMKAKNLRFLCATDVAARGIDISNLSHVINFSVPESPEVYVHRTGRTGRAGKKGTALSLVGPRELGNFRYVRLQFGIKPEERLLPKDDIFIGKLKVPLPPVGVPQPPDPVQILIRGVSGTPSDLERSIFEKLLQKADGKRVLAKLVADKLDSLSTKTSPRRQRSEAAEGEGGDRPRFEDRGERGERRFDRDRGDRPRFGGEGGDRERPRFGDRGDRPRFGGEGGDRERPRFGADGERGPRGEERGERGERGDRPRFGADGERGERGDRDRGERGDRPRFGGEDRGERGERRFDRDRGERGDRDRGDRGDRPRFGDRDRDRGERRFDRDRDRNRDEVKTETNPVVDTGVVEAVTTESSGATAQPAEAREGRGERGDRDRGRDRDRGDRGDRHEARGDRGDRGDRRDRHDRDRDRGDRHGGGRDRRDTEMTVQDSTAPVEAATEAVVETTVAPVEVPVASTAREDRHGKKKDKRGASEVTEATREFWETWAENKTPHVEKAAAKPAAREEAPATEEASGEETEERTERKSARGERGGRGRDRDRGRGSKSEKSDKRDDDKRSAKKSEEPARAAKRDTEASAAASGDQARLFISLGKKHGVSADDLRTLLAGPIGGDTSRIGSVSLRDSHAHVRVPEDAVDAIISGVHGTLHNDHNVTVERARA